MNPTNDRPLDVAEAAWLTRVNDDTVRAWFKRRTYPGFREGEAKSSTTWTELADWCSLNRRAEPLPLVLLSMSTAQVSELLAAPSPGPSPTLSPGAHEVRDVSPGVEVRALQGRLKRSGRRERRLRTALREAMAGASNARAAAASAERALAQLLDEVEEQASE